MEKEVKYLVIADVSREMYSTSEYLFGIFDSEGEAINFIRGWKPEKRAKNQGSWGNYKSFNFLGRWGKKEVSDEELINAYVTKFDGTPICVGSYIE